MKQEHGRVGVMIVYMEDILLISEHMWALVPFDLMAQFQDYDFLREYLQYKIERTFSCAENEVELEMKQLWEEGQAVERKILHRKFTFFMYCKVGPFFPVSGSNSKSELEVWFSDLFFRKLAINFQYIIWSDCSIS